MERIEDQARDRDSSTILHKNGSLKENVWNITHDITGSAASILINSAIGEQCCISGVLRLH